MDAAERMHAEVDAIQRAAGRVPAPEIVHVDGADCVVTFRRLPGRHGQELIDEGHADRVLEAAGRTLRSLHADSRPPAWTHGDYGPQNLLYDPATLEVTGVLDWEFARRGDPVEDLAWAEWIVRMHHAGAATSLGHLFQGWGERAGMGSSPRSDARRLQQVPRSGRAPTRSAGRRPMGVEGRHHRRLEP